MMPASGAREPAARGALPPAARARTAGVHPACRRGGAPPCTKAECGDGKVNRTRGEACDDSGDSPSCDDDCTFARCGDGYTNEEAGEQCDGGGVDTATCNKDCTLAVCHDAYVNLAAGEECDTAVPTSFCNDECKLTECGDGVIDVGEQCDTSGQSATCNTNCSNALCGDGIVNASFVVDPFHNDDTTAGEQCDPGTGTTGNLQRASTSSPACDRDCTFARCGDGYENPLAGEQCDDAYVASGPKPHTESCDSDCTIAACGDGTVNPEFEVDLLEDSSTLPGEQCDPGTGTTGNNKRATSDTATCNRDCSAPRCGDAYVNAAAGESCDDLFVQNGSKPNTVNCDSDCTFPACGDGIVNDQHRIVIINCVDRPPVFCANAPGEFCDPGTGVTKGNSKLALGDSAGCDRDCTQSRCGDGYVNAVFGEQCDPVYYSTFGNGAPEDTAACDANCTFAECGDEYTNEAAGEDCDDGEATETCNANCTVAECGNGVTDDLEECDDGNDDDGDECRNDCTLP